MQTTLTVIGTGIALAGLDISLIAWLRSDLNKVRDRLEQRLVDVEKAQAHTTGLLEGIGLTGRVHGDASAAPAGGD